MGYWRSLSAGVAVFVAATSAAADVSTVTLKIDGMSPAGCSSPAAVRGTMKSVDGVTQAEVSLERGEAVVEFDPAKVDLTQLVAKVERYCQVKVTRPPAP